jgi:hypothetical protein
MVSIIRWNLSINLRHLKKLLLILSFLIAAEEASAQTSGSSHTVTLKLESLLIVQDITSQTSVVPALTNASTNASTNNSLTKSNFTTDRNQVVTISSIDGSNTGSDKTSPVTNDNTKLYTVSKL